MSDRRSGPDSSREAPLGELLLRLAEQGTALGEARIHMARTELARDLATQVESRIRRAFDPRLQMAKHHFVVAAVVLGAVFVATRAFQSVLRRVRTPDAGEPRRRCNRESLAVAYASGRKDGVSEANVKEACE